MKTDNDSDNDSDNDNEVVPRRAWKAIRLALLEKEQN